MSTTRVFYPHAIRGSAILGGAEQFCITLLDDITPDRNFSDLASWAAAQVGPQFTGSHVSSPDCKFTTSQLGTLLTQTIAGNYYVAADLTLQNVDVYYREGANLGMRTAGGNNAHLMMRGQANALLALEGIAADSGQLATARARLAFALNSQTGLDPLVATAGQPLAGLASGGSLYTMGPVFINGVLIDGAEYSGIDFNLEYEEHQSHGDEFPTYIGIYRYRPVYTIRARASDYFATYGSRGTTLSSCIMYLRQKLASGINVADATPQHLKLTSSTGTIKARNISGPKGLVELTVEPYQSAPDTAPVVITANVAIT
jgi:hypothetical protein